MKKQLPKRFYKKMKPEAIAVPVKRFEFPNIPLVIPETVVIKDLVISRVFLFNFVCGFLLMGIGIVLFDARQNMAALQALRQERKGVEAQLLFWKTVVTEHSSYRDAVYKLATIEYRLGYSQQAYESAQKALQLDPEFVQAKQLIEEIKK